MKLVRHGQPGNEHPGLVDPLGSIRDLGAICADVGPAFFVEDAAMHRIRAAGVGGSAAGRRGYPAGTLRGAAGQFHCVQQQTVARWGAH